MSEDTFERVKRIVVELMGADPDKVVPEAEWKKDLGADSLDMVELMMCAEEEFAVDIDDLEAEQAKTVGDAVKLVDQALAKLKAAAEEKERAGG